MARDAPCSKRAAEDVETRPVASTRAPQKRVLDLQDVHYRMLAHTVDRCAVFFDGVQLRENRVLCESLEKSCVQVAARSPKRRLPEVAPVKFRQCPS